MTAYHFLEIAELSALIAQGEVSPVEVTRHQLDRIAALDGRLHSFAFVAADQAMTDAEAAEAELRTGRRRGPLHGVPIGIKDLLWTAGMPTAGGTAIHRDFVPARDATVVQRLRAAGAIILGKLQMTEGAYSEHHPSVTPPVNPWNAGYWTGISSSGPGVALAAGLCHGAIGSDTGGSIRWPSAANGLTGIKPTWGRVSRDGTLELAASLDHVGPMARSATDAALLFDAIAGPDERDPTALQAGWSPTPEEIPSIRGLRVGIDRAWNTEDVDEPVARAVEETAAILREQGAEIIEVAVPNVASAVADWPLNCAVEAAVAHAQTYPARRDEYGPVLAAVLDGGRSLDGVDYQRVLLRRMALRGRFDALFTGIDLLLCPVQPFAPMTLGTVGTMGERPDLVARLQRFTCPFDMTGTPTITLPVGASAEGLPLGAQLVADRCGEAVAIRAARAFQAVSAWHRRHPAAV